MSYKLKDTMVGDSMDISDAIIRNNDLDKIYLLELSELYTCFQTDIQSEYVSGSSIIDIFKTIFEMIVLEIDVLDPTHLLNDIITHIEEQEMLPLDDREIVKADIEFLFQNLYKDITSMVEEYCDHSKKVVVNNWDIREGKFIAGEGGPTNITVSGKYNVITHGSILLIRESRCSIPTIAIHELLHVLGFKHSNNLRFIILSRRV